jgi:NADPH:quinone reductase
LTAKGGYQLKPPLPFIPGSEFAGVIEAVGENVDQTRIGERVMGVSFGSTIATRLIVSEAVLSKIPETLSFEEASVFPATYRTSYYALVHRASLKAGETVLVLGAAGATGYAAIQIAKSLGARVIGSASSERKRALAMQGGADAMVDATAADWRELVMAANFGRGIDIVFDTLGDRFTDPAFRSLTWNGRHLVIGFAAGQIPKLPIHLTILKGASLIGVDVRQLMKFEPELGARCRQAVVSMAAAGKLRPAIGKVYDLEDFVAAFEDAGSRERVGSIIIRMP